MALKVVVVCTGNVCRSPMVERLLAARLGSLVEVSSAGTQALVGQDMTPESAAVVRRWGASPTGHVARQLDERSLAGAELVLTATTAHRAAVLELEPVLVRRTFTLGEAGRLVALMAPQLDDGDPSERLRSLCDGLPFARGRWPTTEPELDDVEDPYRASDYTYARVAGKISQTVDAFADALRLPAL